MVLYISISDGKNEDLPDNVFVRFKSNQCIHCIHSQPDWDKTVKHIRENYEDPLSGMVEVESGNEHLTNLKDKNGDQFVVKGYPTYAIFKNGILDSLYTDSRTFESLTKAIVSHLNLHNKKKSIKKPSKRISKKHHKRSSKKTRKPSIHRSIRKSKRHVQYDMPTFHIYPTELDPEIITRQKSIQSPKEFDDEIESIKSKKFQTSEDIDEEKITESLADSLNKTELLDELESVEDKIEENDVNDILSTVTDESTPEDKSVSNIVKPFMKPFKDSEYDEEELKRKTNSILRKLQEKIKLLIDQEQEKETETSSKTDLSLSDAPTLELKNVDNEYMITPSDKPIEESLGGKTRRKRSKRHKQKGKKYTRKHRKH
jgi:hypothetical protein